MDQLFKKWLPSQLDQSTCSASGPTALGMLKVASAFLLLAIGVAVAAVIMLMEWMNGSKGVKRVFERPGGMYSGS